MTFARRAVGLLAAGLMLFTVSASTWMVTPVRASDVQVTVNGRPLALDPAPVIVGDRTMVPLRQIFEALSATVHWDDHARTVTATRNDAYVHFTVGDRFACLDQTCDRAALMDVPSQIMADRTFVPLRFVATALGAQVDWNDATRTVHISGANQYRSMPELVAPTHIAGTVPLRVTNVPPGATEVRFFLLDKNSAKGPVIARGTDMNATYYYRPDPALNGSRYLAAVTYDAAGRPLYSDLVTVNVAAGGGAQIQGVTPGQTVTGPVDLTVSHEFVAAYARFTLVNLDNGEEIALGDVDPEAPLTWVPLVEQNGRYRLTATLFDRNLNAYAAPAVDLTVAATPVVVQDRLENNQEITGRATVRLKSNFQIERIEIREGNQVLHQAGRSGPITIRGTTAEHYATFTWMPKQEHNGVRTVRVIGYDKAGNAYDTGALTVTINTKPQIWFNVGPDQLVNGPLDLKITSNVPLDYVEYNLIDPQTGRTERIAGGTDASATYTWNPPTGLHTVKRLQGAVRTQSGALMYTPVTDVQVVTIDTHGPTAIVPQNRFRALIEPMAVETLKESSMSASLQVAQAILETGWGQYVPTDKYTGKVSYNLFGIKGAGTNGSVTSNTWEVFGGITYRVEDKFRAYLSVSESWQDHKAILRDRAWYEPFRQVMYDPVRGAWGLLRSGYATDPEYAIKLIRIQRDLELWQLDWIQP